MGANEHDLAPLLRVFVVAGLAMVLLALVLLATDPPHILVEIDPNF
jgi:hypothetical protein